MLLTLEQARVSPGGVVRGRADVEDSGGRVELSVLWETAGKGSTDRGVIHHVELPPGEHAFEVPLPRLPLTYVGTMIKVHWLVRLRRISTLAADDVVQEEFEVAW